MLFRNSIIKRFQDVQDVNKLHIKYYDHAVESHTIEDTFAKIVKIVDSYKKKLNRI